MAQIADIIKYEGDNSTFIWKHLSEDFNSLTQLIVHESQEAIFFIPNRKYNHAIVLLNNGNIVEAYEALREIEGYKDSAEKARSIFRKAFIEKNGDIEIGGNIFFGTYEQDNNASNGKEDIEWLVLDEINGKVLVISRYALDYQQYHNTNHTDATWKTCSLREWLNGTFLNAAFCETEISAIPTAKVSANMNPLYDTDPGISTRDKVFLLSIAEANEYFSSYSERECETTAYAESRGEYVNGLSRSCRWWLRSPGGKQYYAAYVYRGGRVCEYGDDVDYNNYAVRPALWIDLNS